ncbi:MAG: tetratricopeptide repeat protein [Chloroherpetonaceae bacterium]|nr:tetratricopeptide repeat protein [Chthonomonadaceae bacterium]MDW8207240.1 tetratricopeptide repeat protein [Chloroherpetonaceae bacterium]
MIMFALVPFRAVALIAGMILHAALMMPVQAQREGIRPGTPGTFSRSPAVPQGGYHPHQHSASNAPRYASTRKTPLAQSEMAQAIIDDVLTRLWEQADRHFHEGEYNHTININRVILQGDPHNLAAYENSAYLLWSTDRAEEAVALLKQGIKANPKHYGLYDELGWYYYNNLKQPEKAIPYYEQAIKYNPPFFTWHNLARCYEKTGQWEKAVKTWEVAVQFPAPTPGAPTNAPAENALRRARAELEKRRKK